MSLPPGSDLPTAAHRMHDPLLHEPESRAHQPMITPTLASGAS